MGRPGSDLRRSFDLYRRAESIILNGTQLYSKMPSVGVQGVSPVYFVRGEGAHVWDLEGKEYIDFTMGLGPCILGYSHPQVKAAVLRQLDVGTIFSLPHPIEVECAELVHKHVPCAEMLRFLKTGSEATQAAVRVARAYTGREKVIRGHYHGWHEWCIASTPRDGGVPRAYREYAFEARYNHPEDFERLFAEHRGEIAAVVIEPVEFEEPKDDFLGWLKNLCRANGALLVFDEVVTGFRFTIGGAQEYYGVIPDIAAFGKGMANGYPLSAVAGRKDVFEAVKDRIFVSSTFGGDTLSLAACIATLTVMRDEPVHARLWEIGRKMRDGFNERAARLGSNIRCVGPGPRLGFDFRPLDSTRSEHLKTLFMQEIVKRGIFFVWNMLPSYVTTDADIDQALHAFEESLEVCVAAEQAGDVPSRLEGEVPITVI